MHFKPCPIQLEKNCERLLGDSLHFDRYALNGNEITEKCEGHIYRNNNKGEREEERKTQRLMHKELKTEIKAD